MKYATYKTIHNWLGLFLLAPIILTAVTGVLWMHEKNLGLTPKAVTNRTLLDSESNPAETTAKGHLTIASALAPENLEAITMAMAEAKNLWGSDDVEVEKFEIAIAHDFRTAAGTG